MPKGKHWLVIGFCLLVSALSMPLAAQELDGVYRGVYDKQPVTASFNKLELSLTGMLSIGKVRYMLLADPAGKGYTGQLTDLDTGRVLTAELSMKAGRLQIQIKDGAPPMSIVLDKAQE